MISLIIINRIRPNLQQKETKALRTPRAFGGSNPSLESRELLCNILWSQCTNHDNMKSKSVAESKQGKWNFLCSCCSWVFLYCVNSSCLIHSLMLFFIVIIGNIKLHVIFLTETIMFRLLDIYTKVTCYFDKKVTCYFLLL